MKRLMMVSPGFPALKSGNLHLDKGGGHGRGHNK